MRATGWIIIGLVVAGAAAGAFFAFRTEPLKPEPVTIAPVKRTTVVKKVRGVGHVEPVTQVKVSANVSGDLVKLLIKDGDKVKRGQLLAEIRRETWAALVKQSEASAKALEGEVALETAQLEQARADDRRTRALYKDRLATDADIERVTANVAVLSARLESARQRVLQAGAQLEEARTKLLQTSLYAPIDGTIISLLKKQGERIRGSDLAEDVLLVLAPLQAMEVQVEVSEQDVVGVQLNEVAEISIDALVKTPIPGKVIEIANSAIIRNPGTEAETTSFQVKVALDQIPERLRSGMSAAVAIITETHKDVLAVPLEAVTARLPSQLEERAEEAQKKKKRSMLSGSGVTLEDESIKKHERPVEIVFAVVDKKAEPRRVKTGISSETEIEIMEGVEAGTEIIVGPYKTLARTLMPGSPITVQTGKNPGKAGSETVAVDRR